MDNFERGKQLVIEGFEEFIKLYFPYLKVMEGLRLLGLSDILDPSKGHEDSLIKIGLDTMMEGLRNATSADEVHQAFKENREFWSLVLPKEE